MKHLLFIPAEAHRAALLGEGIGGSHSPVAVPDPGEIERHVQGVYPHDRECDFCAEDWPCGQPDRVIRSPGWQLCAGWEWERKGAGYPPYPLKGALILVWDGKVASEGLDRLFRVCDRLAVANFTDLESAYDGGDGTKDKKTRDWLLRQVGYAEDAGLGTSILVEEKP